MAKAVKSHNFRGKRYNIKKMTPKRIKKTFGGSRNKRTLGYCDPPSAKRKHLMFDSTLHGVEELDTNIHEAVHACFWDLAEHAVDRGCTDIAKFLWRLGYRKVE